jgi:hypothetical protein
VRGVEVEVRGERGRVEEREAGERGEAEERERGEWRGER